MKKLINYYVETAQVLVLAVLSVPGICAATVVFTLIVKLVVSIVRLCW
jgi:hypothetical protein